MLLLKLLTVQLALINEMLSSTVNANRVGL